MLNEGGNHNAGDVHFGRDGYLYVSIGDGGCDHVLGGCQGANDASRDEHVLIGKVLRITKTGDVPPDNPFTGPGTARCNVTGQTTPGNKCQETFAWGFRNPFRIAFDPNDAGTRFFINDVGQGGWEEINEAQAGADYGWNCREGAHPFNTSGPCSPAPPGMVDPIFEYEHGVTIPGTTSPTNCTSVTGGAFVPNGVWPGFDGAYLFADFVCGEIFKLSEAGGTWSASDFAILVGTVTSLTFGPHGNGQALYYTTYANFGLVRKIFYDQPGNDPPIAVAAAHPLFGPAPLMVTFDATGSSDPDAGDTLTYFWDFGDGTPETSTASLTIAHTYDSPGVYTASLRARDNHFAFSAPSTAVIQPGNTPPVPAIVSPAAGETFRVGQTLTLTGSATDAQDGILPGSALTWRVLLNHNGTHTHPWFGPVTGNDLTFPAPAPEDLDATDGSFLEVHLEAIDSHGLTTTVQRDMQPSKVTLTFDTDPVGLELRINGATLAAPHTFTSWEDWGFGVYAPSQSDGVDTWVFESWSDGGGQQHTIVTPAAPTTYTATFQPSVTVGPLDFHTAEPPCRLLDTRQAGPPLAAGSTRIFVAVGNCGIPLAAKAIAVNLTVISPPSGGHLRVWPAGTPLTHTSALNFAADQTRANNAVLGLGAGGDFSVFSGFPTGTAHLIVDVSGWFE
jgi:hypothetical protein